MIFNSFFSQIVMAVLAIGILFFYVHPTFTNIAAVQDSISQYEKELGNVNSVNDRLLDLDRQIKAISPESVKSLLTYLPNEFDQMSVSRDLLTMTEKTGTYLESVRYDLIIPRPTDEITSLTKHNFNLTVSGTYENIKLFLANLEQNNYSLEVHKLNLVESEDSLMKADMTVIAYSYNNDII